MRLLAMILAFTAFAALHAEQPVWEPTHTWVFAVGVLKFETPGLATWPDEGRMDAEMIRVLEKRGVPSDHILFLKNEAATKEHIVHEMGPFFRRAGADDTLIFYYAGHGARDYSKPERTCTLVTYDAKSNWTVSSVFDTVGKNFHGKQVLYTADCCHSGSLVVEASHHKGREAELSSAHVSSTSTGNWTFTRCLVEMFQGDPLLDLNGDGKITLAEAAHFVVDEMAFVEGQHSAQGYQNGFSPDTVISVSTGKHTPRMGELIEGESQGKWWKAEVIGEKEGQVFVTWPGWERKFDEWLPLSRTRPYKPKTYAVGDAVKAEWRGTWYDAKVIKVELGLNLVHYTGFPDSDDEWMVYDRLRVK